MIHTGLESLTIAELADRLPVDAPPIAHELAAKGLELADQLEPLRKALANARALQEAAENLINGNEDDSPADFGAALSGRLAALDTAVRAFTESDPGE